MNISKLLTSDGYFLYNKHLARILGPEEAILIGLFCSKHNYYEQENKLTIIGGKQYFYCTREDIENNTGLKKTRQLTTIKNLEDSGILLIKKIGMPAKNYYCLQFNTILQLFENNTTSGQESGQQVVRNTDSSNNINSNTPSINSISKDIELKDEEYKGKETSPSYSLENNSNKKSPLEDFRKNYITNSKTKNKEVNEVIEYLNNVTGKKYRSNIPGTVKLITARLKDGYTVEDMKKVISHRWELWRGTDMEQYVRPSTLFRPSNFEGYLNSLGTKRKLGNRGCPDTLNMFGINSKNAYSKTVKDKEFSEESF